MRVYRPVSWWVEERDPKVLLGVTGELLQEGVSAAQKQNRRAGYEAGTACATAGDLQCVTSSVVSLTPLFAYALLSEPLKCFPSANP